MGHHITIPGLDWYEMRTFLGIVQAKQDVCELKQQSVALKDKLAETEADVKIAAEDLDKAIAPIGNLVHDSVPVDDDEVCGSVLSDAGPQGAVLALI